MADTPFVKGAAKLKVRIATIRAALAIPAFTQEIGELLVRRTKARFEQEVDPSGLPWKPLKAETLMRKKRRGQNTKILQSTGDMKAAIKVIRGLATGSVYTNTGAGVRVGISDPEIVGRAKTHQRGYKKVPMRRFLGIARTDVRSVDSFLRRKAVALNLGG